MGHLSQRGEGTEIQNSLLEVVSLQTHRIYVPSFIYVGSRTDGRTDRCFFYHATPMHNAEYAVGRRLFVRLFVRHTPVFCLNG